MLSKSTRDQMGSSSKQTLLPQFPFVTSYQAHPHSLYPECKFARLNAACFFFFVLLFLGRWRREPCWLTPPPLTLLSQKKWQSLRKRWVLCLWMLQCQEVKGLPEKQSLHFGVLRCFSIDNCIVALLHHQTFKTFFIVRTRQICKLVFELLWQIETWALNTFSNILVCDWPVIIFCDYQLMGWVYWLM